MLAPRVAVVFVLLASLSSPLLAMGQERSAPQRNVAVFVYDGVELLDFAGPAEVFANANINGRRAFNVYTVAPEKRAVRSNQSVTVMPEYSIDDCPKPDILVIPGGSTNLVLQDARAMQWIGMVARESEITLTVCTGAFTLARQGLLDGLKATTHYSSIEGLRRASPQIEVLENVRFVDNGRIVTTAGISAGIDGSLHVVSRLCGEESAWATARYMEYDWSPPPLPANASSEARIRRAATEHGVHGRWQEAVAAREELAKLSPNDASAQYRLAETLLQAGRDADAAIAAERARELGYSDPGVFVLLARAQLGSGHYQAAVENYGRAMEAGLDSPVNRYNLACAHARAGNKDAALEALSAAIEQGQWLKNSARQDEDLASLRGHPQFEKLIAE